VSLLREDREHSHESDHQRTDAAQLSMKDDKGRVTELVLRQGGGERPALRIK
jgi:hypothetical protein